MFGETTISHVKIGNHPIETTIYKWLFGVPGSNLGHLKKFRVGIKSVKSVHQIGQNWGKIIDQT